MQPPWPHIHLIGEKCALAVDRLDNCQNELLPDELYLLNGATHARERELRAGRTTARRAFALLGYDPGPLHASASGAPQWPTGMTGSVSHSREHIAVIVAPVHTVLSLGIDIEDGRPLSADAARDVASDFELREMMRAGWVTPDAVPDCLVFSAKEAFFKCQFPVTENADLSFSDVEIYTGYQRGDLLVRSSDVKNHRLNRFASRVTLKIVHIQGVRLIYALAEA